MDDTDIGAMLDDLDSAYGTLDALGHDLHVMRSALLGRFRDDFGYDMGSSSRRKGVEALREAIAHIDSARGLLSTAVILMREYD